MSNFDIFNLLDNPKPSSNPRSDNSFSNFEEPKKNPAGIFGKGFTGSAGFDSFEQKEDDAPIVEVIRTAKSRQGRRVAGDSSKQNLTVQSNRPTTAPALKEAQFSAGPFVSRNTADNFDFPILSNQLSQISEEPHKNLWSRQVTPGENQMFRDKNRKPFRPTDEEDEEYQNIEGFDQFPGGKNKWNQPENYGIRQEFTGAGFMQGFEEEIPGQDFLVKNGFNRNTAPGFRQESPNEQNFNYSPNFENRSEFQRAPGRLQGYEEPPVPQNLPQLLPKQKAFIEQKQDFDQLSETSRKIKGLQEELKKAKSDQTTLLEDLKARFEEDLIQEKTLLKTEHDSRMNELKQAFELKKSSLQSFKEHSEKVETLAEMINKQSHLMSILNNKFSKEKDFLEDIKSQELFSKEKSLDQRESRLIIQLKSLDQSRSNLLHKQSQLSELESRLRQDLENEKLKLFEEQKAMTELKDLLRNKDREKKNLLAVEQHKLELMQEHVEREEQMIEEEIRHKQNEISEKQTLMEQEKNEAYSLIQYEKSYLAGQISALENFRRNLPVKDAELNKRASLCEEKSKQLLVERENLKKAQEMLEKDRIMFEKEAQKVHLICLELDKESEMLMEQKEELDRKKQELDLKRQEVIAIKEMSRADIARVEQLKASVSQRKRVYESLKTPVMETDLQRFEQPQEYEQEVQRPVSSYRPRSVAYRSSFRADEYLKELEPYNKVSDDIQGYISREKYRLLQSKLEYETGVHRSIKSSFQEFSTPSSSYYKKGSNYFNANSFARPGDSHFGGSYLNEGRLDLYKN
jgi:hypothetical protein